jgi:hypothetical protein
MRSFSNWLGIPYFVHPVPLMAVGVLVLNDHFLKYQFPSFVTGKLSDLAGVFFFPLFLCAVVNVSVNFWRRGRAPFWWITRPQVIAAMVLTDFIFVGIKLSVPLAEHYVDIVTALGFPSRVTQDPTDLIALGMNPLTYFFAKRFFNDL